MKLTVSNYSDNKAHLEYINTPSKPRYAPAYVISGKRADEFVKKYNEQSESLVNNTILLTIAGLITGCGMGLSQNSKKLSVFLKSFLGAIIGLISGISISKYEKNKLMDKYNVEQY